MMFILSVVIFLLAAAASLFLLALGLPGNWALLAGTLLAIALSPKAALTFGAVFILLGVCIFAEVVEWLCGVFGARRYGVSKAGVLGALIGGLIGAILLGSVIPVVGAIPGGFIGTFLGAFLAELSRGQNREQALRLGWGAFTARMLALVAKFGVTFTMAAIGFFFLF